MASVFEQRDAKLKGKSIPGKSAFQQRSEQIKEQEESLEPFWKSAIRTVSQIPQGIASTTGPGLMAGLWEMLAAGEILDSEEIEHIKMISEREGIPFDEEAYREAAEKALSAVPTVSNIAKGVEHFTGAPLEPKTRLQKGLRFATEASRLAPKPGTFRGMNISLQRPVLGAGVEATKELLQEIGVPEPLSELASFAILKHPPEGAPSLEIGKKRKPSGLIERQFEKTTAPKEISENALSKINKKVERDFKQISDKIIKESPVGETAQNLKNDPLFKQQSRELLNQAQEIANTLPDVIPSKILKKQIADISAKKTKGFALNEYDKNYIKFVKENIKAIVPENVTMRQLVEQYRKNNESLAEYFEPGASKALNRAKRDAILDHNRSIAAIVEKSNPELSKVFKEGNDRWTKIMDVEAVDGFVNELFKDGINYKKMNDFFDKQGYEFKFKRALGEKGYKDFQGLVKDMLTSETPYKMLKVAKSKGFEDLFKTGLAYFLHPKIGAAKLGIDVAKKSYKGLINSLLDKPQLTIKFKKGLDNLKKGNFVEAEKELNALKGEIEVPQKGEVPKSESETIEVKPKNVKNKINKPDLIEYKPKPKSNQTAKDRISTLSRSSFQDKIKGKKISHAQKKVLKDTEVSLLQTRGKGKQFHGTSQPIKELSEDIYSKSSEQNIYGPGFYTTDALDIADGYAKSKFAKQPSVYQVKEKTHQKLYDIEKPIKEFKENWIEQDKKHFEFLKEKMKNDKYFSKIYEGTYEDYIKKSDYLLNDILHNENPKSVRDFYDKIRERAIQEGLKAYEVQEYFDSIQSTLEKMGYEGISHKGGLLTNNPEHLVKIYWKPQNLEIQEFYYPKKFKEAAKIGIPAELKTKNQRKS